MKRLIFCISLILVLISCSKVQKEQLALDDSNPHSLSSDINWLVISEPYVAAKKEADWNSSISFHAKKGEVFEIKGKVFSEKNKVWYIVENGYLEDKSVVVFQNYYQAKNYSNNLLENK